MPFSLSPSVVVNEKDLSTTIPAVASSIGGMVGQFEWGPVEEATTVDSENTLILKFGKPLETNYQDWFCAANFLSYSGHMELVRVVASDALNASDVSNVALLVKNLDDHDANITTTKALGNNFIARYPGAYGNSISVAVTDQTNLTGWTYEKQFAFGLEADEIFVVVLFDGNIVEKFHGSTVNGQKDFQGSSLQIADVINRGSSYIFFGRDALDGVDALATPTGDEYNPATIFTAATTDEAVALTAGVDGAVVATGERIIGNALLANADTLDVNLIFAGAADPTAGQDLVDNVAEVRKDAVIFISPPQAVVVNNATAVADMVDWRNGDHASLNLARSSSYVVVDGNYKYQYDKYNDKYRWIPLNGDIAGLCARTDATNDPWWSPGGLNRGKIKNVVKLAIEPSSANLDTLYNNSINPVIKMQGEGFVLWGDKTLLNKPSAFDRINVRRLFIVLEKAISTSAKYKLFEFNDAFTRSLFRNESEPFLRDVQGRRGIFDFLVICDETNNTTEVIDRNEFVADIYVKPARSINYIYLNFVATKTGVSFEEVIGA